MEQLLLGYGMQNGVIGIQNGLEEKFDLNKLNDLEKFVEKIVD